MPKIFVSYRRADSEIITGRIYDRLTETFGRKNVFKDVDNIPIGADFRTVIRSEVGSADITLVVIGPDWPTVAFSNGQRRLDDPNDYVRLEVEYALQNRAMLVIPVLVKAAQVPAPSELPTSLQQLCYLNAVSIRNDPDFNNDMRRLTTRIQEYTREQRAQSGGGNRWRWLLIALMVLLVCGGLTLGVLNGWIPSPIRSLVPRTQIAQGETEESEVTATPQPTSTVRPSNTPVPTATEAPTSTARPVPAPVADFTIDRTTVSVGEAVTFTNTSTGSIDSFAWVFGNTGGSTSAYSPTHTFYSVGTYNVELRAFGPGGSNTQTRQVTVQPAEVSNQINLCIPDEFEPFDDPRIHDAILYGIQPTPDDATIVLPQLALSGAQPTYNPDMTLQLLDEAGFGVDSEGFRLRPDGELLTLTIFYPQVETIDTDSIAHLILSNLEELGIAGNLTPVPTQDLFSQVAVATATGNAVIYFSQTPCSLR